MAPRTYQTLEAPYNPTWPSSSPSRDYSNCSTLVENNLNKLAPYSLLTHPHSQAGQPRTPTPPLLQPAHATPHTTTLAYSITKSAMAPPCIATKLSRRLTLRHLSSLSSSTPDKSLIPPRQRPPCGAMSRQSNATLGSCRTHPAERERSASCVDAPRFAHVGRACGRTGHDSRRLRAVGGVPSRVRAHACGGYRAGHREQCGGHDHRATRRCLESVAGLYMDFFTVICWRNCNKIRNEDRGNDGGIAKT